MCCVALENITLCMEGCVEGEHGRKCNEMLVMESHGTGRKTARGRDGGLVGGRVNAGDESSSAFF